MLQRPELEAQDLQWTLKGEVNLLIEISGLIFISLRLAIVHCIL